MASKMEQLLEVPGFSKLPPPGPGSREILIRRFIFRGDPWDVKVLPYGFSKGVPSCIMVWVIRRSGQRSASRINVSLEILDNTRPERRTVFQDERVAGGYASLKVKRRELDITSCVDVDKDIITVRCTLTCMKKKKSQKKAAAAAARSNWWRRQLRNLLLAPLKLSEEVDVIPDYRPSTIHHLITIPGYSQLAQMPAASSLTLRRFRFLGHTWSITLIPNWSNQTSADSIFIMATRQRDSGSANSGIDIAIEILDKSHKHALFYKKQVLGDDDIGSLSFCSFCSTLMVNKIELEAASCLNQDTFTITCTLTSLDTKQQRQQDKHKIGSTIIPRTTDESDSVRTPLLSHQKLFNF